MSNRSLPILAAFLIIPSCGGSASNSGNNMENNGTVSRNIELMDVRSSVIILQSEIIDLKEKLRDAEGLNLSLHAQLEEKNSRLGTLESLPDAKPAGFTASLQYQFSPNTSELSFEFDAMYKSALALYFDSDYEDAIIAFDELGVLDDSNPLSDNAQYWKGESYYGLGEWGKALSAFETVLTYPQSNKNDYAQFKIGLCLLKMNNEAQADAAFQTLLESYPDSELISRVTKLMNRTQ